MEKCAMKLVSLETFLEYDFVVQQNPHFVGQDWILKYVWAMCLEMDGVILYRHVVTHVLTSIIFICCLIFTRRFLFCAYEKFRIIML
jgi:hypothetical protein